MTGSSTFNPTSGEENVVTSKITNSVESRKEIERLSKRLSGDSKASKMLASGLDMIQRSLTLGEHGEQDKRYMEHIVKSLKARLKEEYRVGDDSSLLKEIDNYVSLLRQEHSEKAVAAKSITRSSVESRKEIERLSKRLSGDSKASKMLASGLDMIQRSLTLGEHGEQDKRYMEHIVKSLKARLKEEYRVGDDSSLLKEIDNYVSLLRQEHSEKAVAAKSITRSSVESRKEIERLSKRLSGDSKASKMLASGLDMIQRSLTLGEHGEQDKRYMEHIVKSLKARLKEEYRVGDDSSLLKEIDNYVSLLRQEHSEKAVAAKSITRSSVESRKEIERLAERVPGDWKVLASDLDVIQRSLALGEHDERDRRYVEYVVKSLKARLKEKYQVEDDSSLLKEIDNYVSLVRQEQNEKVVVAKSITRNSIESRKEIERLSKRVSGDSEILASDLDMIQRSLILGERDEQDKRYMEYIVKSLKARLRKEYQVGDDSSLLKEIDNYVSFLRREYSEKAVAAKSITRNSIESREEIERLSKRLSGDSKASKMLASGLDMIQRSLTLGEHGEQDKRYMERIVKSLKARLREEYQVGEDSSLFKEIDNYVSFLRREHSEKAVEAKSIKSRKEIERLSKRLSRDPKASKILAPDLDMIQRSLTLCEHGEQDKRYMERIVKSLKARLKEEYRVGDDSSLLKEIDNYVSLLRQEYSEKAVAAKSITRSSVESRKEIERLSKRLSGDSKASKILAPNLDMIQRGLAFGKHDGRDKVYMEHVIKSLKNRLKEKYYVREDSSLFKEIDNYVSSLRREHSEKVFTAKSITRNSIESRKEIERLSKHLSGDSKASKILASDLDMIQRSLALGECDKTYMKYIIKSLKNQLKVTYQVKEDSSLFKEIDNYVSFLRQEYSENGVKISSQAERNANVSANRERRVGSFKIKMPFCFR
ncbi:hypothetical protein [Bartonella sp. 114]|uniref:hypothetical protein n=1 Tax=Bartonella sp. 114 TaxID=1933909 RepID=UPI00099AFA8D|nr:hypothetical protein [Bartonella sp. 114]AQX23383.1 hypothetical protein Bho114_000360 [Bartonella sp. 114]